MARRVTKAESTLIVALVVIGLTIYAVVMLFKAIGWVIPTLVVIAIVVFVLWHKHDKKQRQLSYLREKYHDEQLVQRIYQGYFWEGQSAEQLRDSLGPPVAIDNKLLKTKVKEVWKYDPRGKNRFGLRVTVEDGYVAGWDQKS